MGLEKTRGHDVIVANSAEMLELKKAAEFLNELYAQPQTRKLAPEAVSGLAETRSVNNLRVTVPGVSGNIRVSTGAQQGSS